MTIRKALEKDLPGILSLLSQVLEVHAVIRPDLFVSGTRKYTESELRDILKDEQRPIFVVAGSRDEVLAYCFCKLEKTEHSNNLRESFSLFIDDFCVDETCRHQHIGRMLCDYVTEYARGIGCYDMTLNLWEGNENARIFYERMGFTPRKTVMEKLL